MSLGRTAESMDQSSYHRRWKKREAVSLCRWAALQRAWTRVHITGDGRRGRLCRYVARLLCREHGPEFISQAIEEEGGCVAMSLGCSAESMDQSSNHGRCKKTDAKPLCRLSLCLHRVLTRIRTTVDVRRGRLSRYVACRYVCTEF